MNPESTLHWSAGLLTGPTGKRTTRKNKQLPASEATPQSVWIPTLIPILQVPGLAFDSDR